MKCDTTSLLLAGCLLLAVAGTATAQTNTATQSKGCQSAYAYLSANSTKDAYLAAGALAKLAGDDFNGTVFLPTTGALQNLTDLVLMEAGKFNNTQITAVPAGVDLFAVPAVIDILKLHLVPDVVIDPTKLTDAAIGADKKLNIPIDTTLLSAEKKQSFCPNATASNSMLSARVYGVSGRDLDLVDIVSKGSSATVVNADIMGVCSSSVIHIIDNVLLPCAPENSTLKAVAAVVAAAAPAAPTSSGLPSPPGGNITLGVQPVTPGDGDSKKKDKTSDGAPLGLILGAAIGGVVLAAVLLALVFFVLKTKKTATSGSGTLSKKGKLPAASTNSFEPQFEERPQLDFAGKPPV